MVRMTVVTVTPSHGRTSIKVVFPSGGMRSDVFDSMAEGVENAACIVPFICQRYQDSENCQVSAILI
jgi:hypothetical protein